MKRLTVLLLLLPVLAPADPSAATRYLMNEPASLMDIGLLRAQLHFHNTVDPIFTEDFESLDPNLIISTGIEYKFDDDLFVIFSYIRWSKDPKARCERLIDKYVSVAKSTMLSFFSHVGFTRSNEPADLENAIFSRIEVHCGGGGVNGRRKFLEHEIY